MLLEEDGITRIVVGEGAKVLKDVARVDAVIVGAGPSGLTAARYLAIRGIKTLIVEKERYVGGTAWTGGLSLPSIIIRGEAKKFMEEIGVRMEGVHEDIYIADPVEVCIKCALGALDAGAKILVGMEASDLIYRRELEGVRICGIVIGPTNAPKPGTGSVGIRSKVVVDATGLEASISRIASQRMPEICLPTTSGGIEGRRSMWMEEAEKSMVRNTKELLPGLIVAGMAANVVFGSSISGPVLSGAIISGYKAAMLALEIIMGHDVGAV